MIVGITALLGGLAFAIFVLLQGYKSGYGSSDGYGYSSGKSKLVTNTICTLLHYVTFIGSYSQSGYTTSSTHSSSSNYDSFQRRNNRGENENQLGIISLIQEMEEELRKEGVAVGVADEAGQVGTCEGVDVCNVISKLRQEDQGAKLLQLLAKAR